MNDRRPSALARAYLDQLERWNGLARDRINGARSQLAAAEGAAGDQRSAMLRTLASSLEGAAGSAMDAAKVGDLADAVRRLADEM